ncbi:hypothetical protein FRB91_003029, partial [Serendipita sp. 411]
MSTQCTTRFTTTSTTRMTTTTTTTTRRSAPPRALVGSISTSTSGSTSTPPPMPSTSSSSSMAISNAHPIPSSTISSQPQRVPISSSSSSPSSSSSSSSSSSPSSTESDPDPAYLPTPPTTPLHSLPPTTTTTTATSLSPVSVSSIIHGTSGTNGDGTTIYSTLPNEILNQIFHHLPNPTLATLLLVNSHFYALCERLLYHTLLSVQLFASPLSTIFDANPNANDANTSTTTKLDPSWRLLLTLSSRPSTALAVRHFAVSGLPWLDEREVSLLVSALCAMSNLVSLEINPNLGVRVERMVVCGLRRAEQQERMEKEEKKGRPRRVGDAGEDGHGRGGGDKDRDERGRGWWSRLTALNVLDVKTALYFLGWDEEEEGEVEEEDRRELATD